MRVLACLGAVLLACGTPPQELAGQERDARVIREGCASGLAFEDISSMSPDLAANPYGGEPGWDHVDKYGPGVGLADLDGDGHLDLVQARAERNQSSLRPPIFYRGLGDGRFEEALRPSWREQDNGTFVLVFDHDGDADLDVLVGVAGGDPRLYRNDGAWAFADATSAAGLAGIATFAYAAAAGDVDGDGDLDLYLAQWRADLPEHGPGLANNYLLLNEDGRFEKSPADLACAGHSTLGVGVVDLDGDRDLDIYVANDFFEDCLYENQGSGQWQEVGRARGIATDAMHAMGVAFGDLNNDQALDIIVTDTEQPDSSRGTAVFLRDGQGYRSAALELGLDGIDTLAVDWLVSWGVAIEDFDLDGHADVHYATHTERLELFWQNLGSTFEADFSLIQGLEDVDARGSAYGDLDGDGDLDIVVGRRGGGLQILRNQQAGAGKSLHVVIEPPARAIGATVRVVSEGREQMRVIQAGSSYMSTSPPVAHFGLCGATAAEQLTVDFADGSQYSASDIPAGRHRISAPPP